jgi:uncharacterized protein YfaS (alpha-2-macroglobulin family)
MSRAGWLCRALAGVWLSVVAAEAQAPPSLTVVSSGPSGVLATRQQANEIRIVFSEPMVTLGRIPAVATAPFVTITPAIPGAFRWSGTTILIFTPDQRQPLPFATSYTVTVDTSAASASGRRLAAPVTFSFTTPPVRLLRTSWYRRDGTVNSRMVVLLRFNQPVQPEVIARHLSATLWPHEWEPPAFPADVLSRYQAQEPAGLAAFEAKVATVRRVAASRDAVALRLTPSWNKQRYPPSPDLVVFETTTPVAPESWIRLLVSGRVPSPAGRATPGRAQTFTIEAEPAFFVDGFLCRTACDGDARNPLHLRAAVKAADFEAALTATDITATPVAVKKAATPRPSRDRDDASQYLTLEDAGFEAQPPDRKYLMSAAASLTANDGQTLGYPWLGVVDNWHATAFTSFGDGHGVWEADGGAQLPFYARNVRDILQWAFRLEPSRLMPTIRKLQPGFAAAPPIAAQTRALRVTPDAVQSHGLPLGAALSPSGTGLVWAAVQDGQMLDRTHRAYGGDRVRASIVQVTNLGVTVKDSPANTLVFVTRLDTGAPVGGAAVTIVRADNDTHWRGTTNDDGVAVAPATPLRNPDTWYERTTPFLVTAEKDGDLAYTSADWHEGLSPWEFDLAFNLRERDPLLRGSVFTDRGVYRLGETVQFKAILRQNAASGVRLLDGGTPVRITVRDGENRVVDERTVTMSPWSTAEWTMPLPAQGTLGQYAVRATIAAAGPQAPAAATPRAGDGRGPDAADEVPYERTVFGSFLVAAYRRPEFRVDVSLTGDSRIAGDPINGMVTARYLFGAPMGGKPVTWRYSKAPMGDAPEAIRERYGADRWVFVGTIDRNVARGDIRREAATLAAGGDLALALETTRDAGIPYVYSLEGDVEDVSRQHIANRGSLVVHPAPWYVGLRRPDYFLQQKNGLKTEIVAVGLDGAPAAGVPVDVTLTRVQWSSVRRAEGNGFYTWDTERRELPAGSWSITTGSDPVPLDIAFTAGGSYYLEARGRGENGRSAVTRTSFYVLGEGYTAWARYDHNRIDLVPEKTTYRPGETARLMIQSPWEQATALVTTEREGIRSHRRFALSSTQQSIDVPITEDDVPNVFVSVLLVKGRTASAPTSQAALAGEGDTSDPGKPSFRLGYAELAVEDRAKRLTVTVRADREEYRPAAKATVMLDVKDMAGAGAASEVTLWAVDYGVLSLTGFQPPDVAGDVYVRKALQVLTTDNRQRIISRRVLTPKGGSEGGGGGNDAGTMRRDFRALAFWLGSVTTGADGTARVDVTLPESLTTYRIMAVAGDRRSRFGSGSAEVRTNKPVTLTSAFPRFLAVGDEAYFGAVVGSQLPGTGTATVTMRSLDPAILTLTGPAEQKVTVNAGGTVEVRFTGRARGIGRARVQMTARIGDETDAFQDVLPVEILASPETVAAFGTAAGAATTARETLEIPAAVVPGYGGLDVQLSSTALVGLNEGARYLVGYPYGCAEQKASLTLALVLAADLGDAFSLPGMDVGDMRTVSQRTLGELERFQCESGGFAYWPGDCFTVSPYLTAYVLHVMRNAVDLGYTVDPGVRDRAYDYLLQALGATPPKANEEWWPSYTAWQAFAVKVLAEGRRNVDSHLTRLYGYRDRMPVFALAYLHDALRARGETSGDRVADVMRRMTNAILPEGADAHVGELADPYLLWFWNSNVRSTAIVLGSLVQARADAAPLAPMVRWLMTVRKNGRWGNTQENAHAMAALVAYYRTYEPATPDFRAVVTLGAREMAREEFRGRSAEASTASLPMAEVLTSGAAGTPLPLAFTREGTGTLYYSARLRYAADALHQSGLDAGFNVERRYEPFVENGARPAATRYAAGDLVRVTLTFRLTKERRFVAVTDPLPAGFEAVESWFATTARDLAAQQDRQVNDGGDASDWRNWWRHSGFDRVERHDDRVQLFATRLDEGLHEFSYIVRATTAGTFRTAPARAEEMYAPEVFGRTATTIIDVNRQ